MVGLLFRESVVVGGCQYLRTAVLAGKEACRDITAVGGIRRGNRREQNRKGCYRGLAGLERKRSKSLELMEEERCVGSGVWRGRFQSAIEGASWTSKSVALSLLRTVATTLQMAATRAQARQLGGECRKLLGIV